MKNLTFRTKWARSAVALLFVCVSVGSAMAGFRDIRAPSAASPSVPPGAAPAASKGASGVVAPIVAGSAPVAPEAPKVKTWSLDNTKTLKENLDGWVRSEGWNPIIWDASNHYRVRLNTDSIEGQFPEVLKSISAATGLNICAKRRDKYVRVTDRGVPCKDMSQ